MTPDTQAKAAPGTLRALAEKIVREVQRSNGERYVPFSDQARMVEHLIETEGPASDLLAALHGLMELVADTDGIAGYHLNGDIAEWDEFPEVDDARDAIERAGEVAP